MEQESLKEWKIEQKKKAYEEYIEDEGIDIDEYRLRLKLIDEIAED